MIIVVAECFEDLVVDGLDSNLTTFTKGLKYLFNHTRGECNQCEMFYVGYNDHNELELLDYGTFTSYFTIINTAEDINQALSIGVDEFSYRRMSFLDLMDFSE